MSNSDQLRRHESDGFTCVHCKLQVPGAAWGTKHRNHCPACLHSRHVDQTSGDRASPCKGVMEPIGIEVRAGSRDGEWAIIHRCRTCGQLRTNRIAGDDAERALLALALRPIANPAFPIDGFR
ncbi:MAG: RNHCP domain-containing protein [Phycisphaerales bacterium]|nr:RNHCP domain-containing protein [Phycisphaerales bacterium]